MATKVNQDMINFIKAQGMTKALKRAGQIQAKGTKGEAEFVEGVRRMYGANRLSAATAKAKPVAPKPTDSRFSGVKKPDPKKPTDSRFSGVKKTAPKPTDSRFSGTKPASAKKAAAPVQKTKDLKKNPVVRFVTSRVGGKSGGYGNSK